jgi:hypothetical protein
MDNLFINKKKKYKKVEFIEFDNDISFENLNNSLQKKNQLFSNIYPPIELVQNILNLILYDNNINNIHNIIENDNIYIEFSKKTLIQKDILNTIKPYIDELKKYYLKCKHNKYLENLNEKKIITIFRQILKQHEYTLTSSEKYDNGIKYLAYVIKKKNIGLKKINSTIHFD